jgi:hypothetical protein
MAAAGGIQFQQRLARWSVRPHSGAFERARRQFGDPPFDVVDSHLTLSPTCAAVLQ